MRALALLLWLAAVSPVAAAEVTIDFDDVASTTVVDDHYADLGIRLTGLGNGGPYEIEAKTSCVTTASPPNAVTLAILGTCPELPNTSFVNVTFDTPQPRVSIMVTHVDATTTTFVRVYHDGQFVDMKFGDSKASWVGLPQKIEVTRQPEDPWITVMQFGTFSGKATFDDLHYAIGPVANQQRSWSAVKARFDED